MTPTRRRTVFRRTAILAAAALVAVIGAWIFHCLPGEGQAALTFAWSLRLTHSDADPERTAIA
jgi:hypothetical protein